jgi:D-glycero-D-manno-heptose 1,7-bisphosphate phosphatase
MSIALFLDRDGTLIRHIPYLSDPAQVELLPGVKAALQHALKKGFLLFLLTNQSGVGRGWFTMEAVEHCNARMLELLELPSPGFTALCIAPEAPDVPSLYRKPSPRFILEMIAAHKLNPAECYMVGDAPSDVEAAHAAHVNAVAVGAQFELAGEGQSFPDLPAFLATLL